MMNPRQRGKVTCEVCSCDSLLSRSAHDQPIIEVLKNQHVPAMKESCDPLHHVSKDPQQGGEAEQQSGELEENSVVAKADKVGVPKMDRDVQVGVLQVDSGRPQRRNQGAEN